jgi:hypothetical protein
MVREPRRLHHARSPEAADVRPPVTICVLGPFRVLHGDAPLQLRCRGKTDMLMATLAVSHSRGLERDELVACLWPDHNPALARQALHSLIHSLHRAFDGPLRGAAPVVYAGGFYRLNVEAGVTVDLARFDALAERGDAAERAGADRQALRRGGRPLPRRPVGRRRLPGAGRARAAAGALLRPAPSPGRRPP